MSTNYSPKIVSDSSLQFHIDINNPKSWKGPPTSNYFYTPTPNSDGSVSFSVNGTGTFYRIYSGTYGGYTIQPSDVVYKYNLANQSGCYYHGNDFALAGGNTCTWSFQYYVSPDAQNYGVSPGNNFISNLEGNIGAGFYANDLRQGVWENFNSGPLYINSTGTGRVLIYPGACNGTYMATSGFILFKNPQFELYPFATAFVSSGPSSAGTRSATQCLLDLTGNVTLDATSGGYDSTGLLKFNNNLVYGTLTGSASQIQYTRLVWVYPTAIGNDYKMALSNTIGNNNDMGIGISTYGNVAFYQYTTTTDFAVTGSSTVSTNRWYMLALTVDRSISSNNIKVYLNGVLDGTGSKSIGNSNSDQLQLGGAYSDSYGGNRRFYGYIGQAMHYNRLLTPAEILQNFNAMKGRYGL